MNRQPESNPYDPPAATAKDETVEHPPWWVVGFMVVGAAILGCMFAVFTCVGIVTIGAPAFRSLSMISVTATIVIVAFVGYLTARSSYREMVRNYWHKRTPLSERPDMQAPVSNAEDHHSSNKTSRP